MARQSRDGWLAVVRPDCDVLQDGRADASAKRAAAQLLLSSDGRAQQEGEAGGRGNGQSVKLRLAVVEEPWSAGARLGSLPISPDCCKSTNVPYAPHLLLLPPSDPADWLSSPSHLLACCVVVIVLMCGETRLENALRMAPRPV
jgi:hypothetical protein